MSLRHALLGLLEIRPMTGYDLKRVIDSSIGFMWSADQSQIYRALAGLVADGLALRRTVVQADRPNQHVHGITEDGRAELDAWLRSPLVEPPVRDVFTLRLFLVSRLGPGEARTMLESRREEARAHLAALEGIEVGGAESELAAVLRRATLRHGIVHTRAEIAWIEETLAQVDGRADDGTARGGSGEAAE